MEGRGKGRLILTWGLPLPISSGEYGNALQAASYKGAKDIVELLLENGADVNAQGGRYGTALSATQAPKPGHWQISARKKRDELIQLLRAYGAKK